MGIYVNRTQHGPLGSSFREKWKGLVDAGARPILTAENFSGDRLAPEVWEPNLVCLVDNGPFAAAAWIYSENELREFNDPKDGRVKLFFKWNRVEEFAGQ